MPHAPGSDLMRSFQSLSVCTPYLNQGASAAPLIVTHESHVGQAQEDLRIALRLDPAIKLLPCVAKDKESVKTVLLELLYSILEEMEG